MKQRFFMEILYFCMLELYLQIISWRYMWKLWQVFAHIPEILYMILPSEKTELIWMFIIQYSTVHYSTVWRCYTVPSSTNLHQISMPCSFLMVIREFWCFVIPCRLSTRDVQFLGNFDYWVGLEWDLQCSPNQSTYMVWSTRTGKPVTFSQHWLNWIEYFTLAYAKHWDRRGHSAL